MDLALVPSELPDRDAVRDSVVTLADFALYQQDKAFFGQPYQPSDARFEWGSNGIILNNAVTLAAAADITGDEAYRTAALESLDYVLGRNALDQSYVTGYGTQFSQNQHHRTFAAQLDPTLPHPPAGTLSGGPNSSIQDPVAAQTWPQGCVAQRCYLDNIQSWSTNEMTVNWNSSLTWMAAWASSDEVVENGPAVVGPPFRVWIGRRRWSCGLLALAGGRPRRASSTQEEVLMLRSWYRSAVLPRRGIARLLPTAGGGLVAGLLAARRRARPPAGRVRAGHQRGRRAGARGGRRRHGVGGVERPGADVRAGRGPVPRAAGARARCRPRSASACSGASTAPCGTAR